MKYLDKFRVVMSVLAIVTVASFAGAVSGSLAWYSYSTRATVAYSGTSVFTSELLQVGIISETDFRPSEDDTTLGIEEVVNYDATRKIYFAKPGASLKSTAINAYLATTDYSQVKLGPVTSRQYDCDLTSDLSLYNAPQAFKPELSESIATHSQYSHIPLAFRVNLRNGSSTTEYATNKNIWLTHSEVKVEPSQKVGVVNKMDDALRVFFDGTNKFIYKPNATVAGETKLAGLLDLSGDGYYDANDDKEIIYGDYDGTPAMTHTDVTSPKNVNENGTDNGEDDPRTTFFAKHRADTDIYTNYADTLDAHVAEYLSINEVKPDDAGGGSLDETTGIALCNTGSIGIAELDLTIWIEGWDHSVIDNQKNHRFYLGLEFKIN